MGTSINVCRKCDEEHALLLMMHVCLGKAIAKRGGKGMGAEGEEVTAKQP